MSPSPWTHWSVAGAVRGGLNKRRTRGRLAAEAAGAGRRGVEMRAWSGGGVAAPNEVK
jgi:hypothetical protein